MNHRIRISLGLLILGMVTALLGLLMAPPAQAYTWSDHRNVVDCTHSSDENICLDVWYQRDMDNKGFKLESVSIEGCYWPCSSVDGQVLKCTNQNPDTVVWSKPGDQINLGRADQKSWAPNLIMPNALELWCSYSGRAHITGRPDWDFTDKIGRT